MGWGDAEEAGSFRLIKQGDRGYFGCRVGQHSLKQFLFPPDLLLWEAQQQAGSWRVEVKTGTAPAMAFLGVRACDLAALEVHDRVLSRGLPCLGPVTRAGCGALCPAFHRGCYGCFGPKETPNTQSLAAWFGARLNLPAADQVRLFRQFYANAEAFRAESERMEGK